MFLVILSLVFIAAGIVVWIAGSIVNRRAAGQQNKIQKKKIPPYGRKDGNRCPYHLYSGGNMLYFWIYIASRIANGIKINGSPHQ